MKKQWVLVSYWTPEGNERLVARVDNIEKAILGKDEHEFVKLEYVRWISEYDFDDDDVEDILLQAEIAANAGEDTESCCCGCDEDEEEEEDDLDLDDLDDGDDEIMRLEDDFIYGTDHVMYLKRENIINVCPIKIEFASFWELTIDTEDETEQG